MSELVAREGDAVDTGHACDTTTTLDTPSQSFVKIEGELVCRKGDLTVSHAFPPDPPCAPHVADITGSSSGVKICGQLVARKGDACDDGKITGSASFVRIG